jgi:serine/threonine protein kinase
MGTHRIRRGARIRRDNRRGLSVSAAGVTLVTAVGLRGFVLPVRGSCRARSVVDRDIKPSNLMPLPGDRVKIWSFGLVRLTSSLIRRLCLCRRLTKCRLEVYEKKTAAVASAPALGRSDPAAAYSSSPGGTAC